MSGSLAAAALGAVQMADWANQSNAPGPITLGEFVFHTFEVPETVNWGGAQQMAVHKLPGGRRVIDVVGRDDADITWSGILLSADATDRADFLNEMRGDGEPRELLFMGRSYTVVIREVHFVHHKVNHVDYTITCTVLNDNSAAGGAENGSNQAAINSDVEAAMGYDVEGLEEGLQDAQIALALIPPIIAPVTTLVAGSEVATKVFAGLGAAQGAVSSAALLASGNILGLATAAQTANNVLGANSVSDAHNNLSLALAATATAATAATMAAFIGRAAVNVPR